LKPSTQVARGHSGSHPSYATFRGWRDGMPDNNSSIQWTNGQFLTFNIGRAYLLAP
jgi:hypothetical protein